MARENFPAQCLGLGTCLVLLTFLIYTLACPQTLGKCDRSLVP